MIRVLIICMKNTSVKMERFEGRVALVTGASNGIGEVVAKRLLAAGLHVVAAARRLDKLKALSKPSSPHLHPYQVDVASTEEVKVMFPWIEDKFPQGLAVCIVNAGLTTHSRLLTANVSEWKAMLNVNVLGASLCAQLAIKNMMRSQNEAVVVFVNR